MSKVFPDQKLFFILTILCILLIILDLFGALNFIKRGVLYATNPISFGIYSSAQKIKSQFDFIFTARFSAQENKALKEQMANLLSENTSLRKRLAEAQSQLTQFKFISPSTYTLIPARPIGFLRYLTIDRGSDSGIVAGQAVVNKDNYIGRIKAVSPKSATILLLSDPDSKLAGFSQGLNGKAKGVVIGQFATEALMDKILHEEIINIEDLVYSEGIEGFLPRGLVLGKVTQIIEDKSQVFKSAKVKPIFDIGDLELVFVIIE